MKKSFKILSAALAAVVLLAGCGGARREPVAESPVSIAVGGTLNGRFHPAYALDECDWAVVGLVYEPLFAEGEDGSLLPALATEMTVSPDGGVVTFSLRRDVKWHSGNPFQGQDVKTSLELLALTPHTEYATLAGWISGAAAFRAGIAGALDGVKVLDAHTVQIIADDPPPDFARRLAVVPIFLPPQTASDDPGGIRSDALESPVGTGPYALGEYAKGQYVRLIPNGDYWGEVPPAPLELTAAELYRTDNPPQNSAFDLARFVDLTDADLRALNGTDLKALWPESSLQLQLVLNHENPYLRQKAFRQALVAAIDRETLRDTLAGDALEVPDTVYLKDSPFYPDNTASHPYDPESAHSALLRTRAFTDKEGVLVNADGEPLTLRLLYARDNRYFRLCPPVIQENLQSIGIRVVTEEVDYWELRLRMTQGGYDMALIITDDLDRQDLYDLYCSDSIRWGRNASRYRNSSLDSVLRSLLYASSPEEQAALKQKAARIISEDVPSVFLFQVRETILYSQEACQALGYPTEG